MEKQDNRKQDGTLKGQSSLHHERPPSPVPTCVSMKSNKSEGRDINFQHDDVTDGSSGEKEECKPDAVSEHFTQGDLKHIFQLLEEKIIDFLKNELKRFKKILNPDYRENFEAKEQDESDAREGALKIALHFLRNMKQKHIADKLQESKKCYFISELKRNIKIKYQSVFEGIPKQGSSALLEKIYTEVYITEGGSGKVNEEHEVRQIESISKRPAGQETPIKCRDIFQPLPGQDKPIRSVIMKGVAGIGKTVSVQKYILDWAEGKENQDIHFIFPLPFRELNPMKENHLSLMDLLQTFFSETKQLTFLSQGKYKVLFIFDGLDECRLQLDFQKNDILTEVTTATSLDVLLTNLIKGNLLPPSLLWITSRPAAANQIPPQNVDRVTEVQGFSDLQKEEYFRKRTCDQTLANKVISHINLSKSLHIMCHIPVFCWIAATVLELLLKNERGKEVPKTLTEMYTYFLVFQTKQKSLKFDGVYDMEPQWNRASLLALGKLAYNQLEKGNLIFYEDDLRESGIDVKEAVVHCGICTQIFREESGLHLEKLYCFVHLSIQEYLAALYVILMLAEGKDLMSPQQPPRTVFQLLKWQTTETSMTTLQKSAVEKALEHEDGRFDLFLRFLLGLSLESNQRLLRGLMKTVQHESKEQIARYIKTKIREIPSSERVLNLFHCLNEVNDHSLVKEVQSFLSAGTLSAAKLSSSQWSALVFVLLTSEERLDVFDLKKYSRSDECLIRLQPVVEESQKALLDNCSFGEEGFRALASALRSNPSHMRELQLSRNKAGDSGVKHLSSLLEDPNCKLDKLVLSDCSITEKGYATLASALRSNPSHMRELQLSGNKAGDSGVKHLSSLLEDPNCKLEKLQLSDCSITEKGYATLASALRSNPSHMRELQLSGNKAGDSGVKHLSCLLEDPNCKLEKLHLDKCSIGEEGFRALASALRSNPSHMRELQLSENKAGDSGVKHLSSLLEDANCKLEKLHLYDCSIGEKGFRALASALRSNPSHMGELQLSGNKAGDSGVKHLSSLLEDPNCKLEKLHLNNCSIGEEGFRALASALRSNPEHMRELQLYWNEAGDSGVKHLSSLLEDPNCKLEKLHLRYSSIGEEGFRALSSALRSNPSHMKELWLSGNKAGDSGVKHLSSLLEDPNCKLEKLYLDNCSIGEEGFRALASALKSNPSHMRELRLNRNKAGDSGVKHLPSLLEDLNCKLKKLELSDCSITEKGYASLASALRLNPKYLIELDLRGNDPGKSGVKLFLDLKEDPQGTLRNIQFLKSSAAEEACAAVASAVGSNPLLMTQLDLSEYIPGVLGVTQLLSDCSITEKGYASLASALRLNPKYLRELDLRGNDPGKSGVKLFLDLKEDPQGTLRNIQFLKSSAAEEACAAVASAVGSNPLLMTELDLSEHIPGVLGVTQLLSDCSITEKGYASLASALRLNPKYLRELDLRGNDPGKSGVKLFIDLKEDPQCTLRNIQFLKSSAAEEACAAVASAVGSNPLLMTELHLSGRIPGVLGVTQLLSDCSITEKGYASLASALRLNPKYLRELDLRGNDPGKSGVKLFLDLKEGPQGTLRNIQFLKSSAAEEACAAVASAVGSNPLLMTQLDLSEHIPGVLGVTQLLSDCSITEKGYASLASALRLNPKYLIELDLRGNDPGKSGVKLFIDLKEDPQCTLRNIQFLKSSAAEEACAAVASAVGSNPLLMTELDLSGRIPGVFGVTQLLSDCSITEKGYASLASALRLNPKYLRELDLRGNDPGKSGVKLFLDLKEDPQCTLRNIQFLKSSAAEEACAAVASAVGSNPLLMTELDLSEHIPGVLGVTQLLAYCSITDEGFRALASALRSNPSPLRELLLYGNQLGPSAQQLLSELKKHPNCKHIKILGL
ncbi:NLR family CARD domain-containing protein 3-like [Sardina pilchardus]|uniref:NLR family CARD domain-containing protein 3-like n=1 Tax=Sardina pilchardus TaxID=27697 RepID=UPI002E0FC8F8